MKSDLIHPAHQKILRLFNVLKILALGYALWVLWRILRPLWERAELEQGLSRFWQRDLSGAQTWQWLAWTAWGLAQWLILALAIAYFWRAMRSFRQGSSFEAHPGEWFLRGAWWLLLVQVLGLATRPLYSWLLTLHLASDQRLLRWDYYPNDLVASILCVVLLVFAYLYTWMAQISAENRSFV